MAPQMRSRGRALLVLAVFAVCRWSDVLNFVCSPPSRSLETVQRRASAAGSEPPSTTTEDKKAGGDKEIDDAVLRMAMAMSEEEEGTAPATPEKSEKKEEGFDFNILVTAFWVSLIIYSFGSSIIGVTQGRIQDRTGGDFTLYDFFDNIFSFSEWNWEYSLGFDPFKLFDGLKNGSASSTPPSA
eukprot:CAMPEP_0181442872 /NCGR_PEP_ID=MMETSP1110-20121109/24255_1 /TAXON_ID=174948 /ORGANISM="Symbiodinium sp., Strain CCMP421" /LENGTH=183 /DNA_ID=CAMNT_0023566817 /DNA_START=44 /DNA_END=595 /DNA_ORIENTATION=-